MGKEVIDMTKDIIKKEQQAVEQSKSPLYLGHTFLPDVDIWQNDTAVYLAVIMPGVGKENASISVEKNVITIRGTSNIELPEKATLTRREFVLGNYERYFTLSEDLETDKIKAKMKNGVLLIEIPRKEYAKPKKIDIE